MDPKKDLENTGADSTENTNRRPELSPKAMYGVAGDLVDLATENSEAAPAAVLATFLTRYAVECGPRPHLMVGDTKHHARLFTVIVGASSKARKGTSAKPVDRAFDFALMNEAGDESKRVIPAKTTPGPLSSGEGLIYAVRDPQEEWKQDRKTGIGQMVVSDPGVEDKRLYVLDEEFASALNCIKRDGNTLSQVTRSAWDNGNIEPLTKTVRTKTTGAHIGICTHITREELDHCLLKIELANGFANRFLWCFVQRPKIVPFPKPMPEKKLFLIRDAIREKLRRVSKVTVMNFGDDAKSYWEMIYPDLTKDRYGLVGSVLSRAEPLTIRLAMVYALLDGKMFIKLEHMQAANAFWQYCKKSAEFIFRDREADAVSGKIVRALREGTKTKTDLHRAFQNNLSVEKLGKAISMLVNEGRVHSRKVSTGGKPKIIYQLT